MSDRLDLLMIRILAVLQIVYVPVFIREYVTMSNDHRVITLVVSILLSRCLLCHMLTVVSRNNVK